MNSGEGHHVDGGPTGSQPASDENPMDTLAAMMTKLKVACKGDETPSDDASPSPLSRAEILDDLHVVLDHILSQRSLTDQLKNSANLETLFGCILGSDHDDGDMERMTSALLKIALRTDPAYVLVNYVEYIKKCLSDQRPVAKRPMLTLIHHAAKSKSERALQAFSEDGDLQGLIVDSLGHEDLGVTSETENLLKDLSEAAGEGSPLFREPMLGMMVDLARNHKSSTAQLRVHEVMLHSASKSRSFMEKVKKTGLLDLFEEHMFGDDFLVQCAALEIATELALSPPGRDVMVENGTMDKMETSLARSAQDEMHAMVMPSYMKVFGMLSRHQEEDCLDKYPEFASLLFDLLQPSTSRELRGKALETIAYICGSPAKKLSTFNRSGMVDRVMSAVRDLCNRGEVEGYEVLAQLLEFHPEGEQQELEMELNKKLLRFCDADYVSKLSDRIKQPFEALAKAAYLVICQLASQSWALAEFSRCPGFMDALLDGRAHTDSEILAQKRATLKLILDQNEARNMFNENIMKRIVEYLESGISGGGNAEARVAMDTS